MSYMDVLSIVLPALAFVCVLLLLFINIYSKIRPNRFVNVNCWFCNQWTKVPSELWNSWDCPFCEQYNGFSLDGGYNKLIPAQHDELMNKVSSHLPITTNKNSNNGLCSTCNNHQQLKVQQLAMFSPINDNNFDEEVEQYKDQLERAYKLCSQCDLTLKATLQKQKSLLLGIRLKTLKQQGLHYLNLQKSYRIISKTAIKQHFLYAIYYFTKILAIIRMFEIAKKYDFSRENLIRSLPNSLVPSMLVTEDLIILIYNLSSSIFVYFYYLQGIVLENCISAITMIFSEYSVENTYFLYKYLHLSNVQTSIGLILQMTFLMLNTKRTTIDYTKFATWILLVFLNTSMEFSLTTKLFEVVLYAFIIIAPSSNYKKIELRTKKPKILPSKDKSEVLNEELNKPAELLNSTFRNESNEKLNESFFGPFNTSTKSFNSPSENLFPVFGKQPVFENSLNVSYFKHSLNHRISSNESFSTNNSSQNSSHYLNDSFIVSSSSDDKVENKSTEFELNKCLNDLHLSGYSNEKRQNNGELPAAFRVSSPMLRPKPVLSPPRLQNVTQSSWVAGGYWKANEFLNNFNGYSNLSRSSSQSSGFSSQASSQQHSPCDNNVFSSLPSSRTNSICGEFDKYSVFSEPAYQYKTPANMCSRISKFYPDQQYAYICPKPINNIDAQKTVKAATILDDGFWNNGVDHFAVPCRPSSRESVCSPNPFNTSFSNYSTCSSIRGNNPYINSFSGNNTLRPLSVNSSNNSVYSKKYSKGNLLQKWREQHSTDLQNL